MLAIRFVSVALATLFLSGFLFSLWVRVRAGIAERIVLSFAMSYGWMFILSVIIPVSGLTIDVAAYLTIPPCVFLGAAVWRRRNLRPFSVSRPPAMAIVLSAAVVVFATAAWFIEAPITGEEAVDLTSAMRFADGGAISFRNTSLLPDTVPVYLFQPYQLALGVIIRFSHVDPFVAFVKLRSVLMLLSLVSVYALVRRLSPSRTLADAAFAVAMLFIAVDLGTWEYNSLFPFVRRGGFSAGVLVPMLMVLALIATRKPGADDDRLRRVAGWTLPLLLLASLSTHPLEMATYLCFLGALSLAILSGFDEAGDRRAVLWLAAGAMMAVGLYFSVHDRFVSVVAEFEAPQKQSQMNYFVEQLKFPTRLLFGRMPNDTRDLFGRLLPDTITGVIGIPALALLVWIAPSAAALLTLALVPLILVYASPAGYMILSLLTSQATVHDVNAHFGLLGLVAVSLSVAGAAQLAVIKAAALSRSWTMRAIMATAAGGVLTGLAWWVLSPLESRALAAAAMRPSAAVVAAASIGFIVLAIAYRRRRAGYTASSMAVVTAAVALMAALPLTRAGRSADQRLDLGAGVIARYEHARTEPSVVDWPSYYVVLRESIRPKLPVPRAVIDELRLRLPPRQVVLADPRYSCSLVVLLDAYCMNPESIYGHYFLTAAPYLDRYVHQGEDGAPWHPFFNRTPGITDAERRLLASARVDYVVADPGLAASIADKLAGGGASTEPQKLPEGWVLFKVVR